MSEEIIIAVITALAALITAIASYVQAYRLKIALQVETLSKLVERFEGESYQKKRNLATLSCLNHIKNRKPEDEIEDILDFFDEVAFLVRLNALTAEMAWHEFYHWIKLYYQAAQEYIKERREKEPAVWEDLYKLYPELDCIEEKKYPKSYKKKLEEKELKKFLKEELNEEGSNKLKSS